MQGIYAICNPSTGKIYIGSSNNVMKRLYNHKARGKAGKAVNKLLKEDIAAGYKLEYFPILELPSSYMQEQIYFIESCFAAAIKPEYSYNKAHSIFRATVNQYDIKQKQAITAAIEPIITTGAAAKISAVVGMPAAAFLTVEPVEQVELSSDVMSLLASFASDNKEARESAKTYYRELAKKAVKPPKKPAVSMSNSKGGYEISRRLKALIRLAGKKQKELADYTNTSPQSMNNKFKRGSFSYSDLVDIANFTGATLAFRDKKTGQLIKLN